MTITEMAQTARSTYRVLVAHGYSRHSARRVVHNIILLHGFGPHGYFRQRPMHEG